MQKKQNRTGRRIEGTIGGRNRSRIGGRMAGRVGGRIRTPNIITNKNGRIRTPRINKKSFVLFVWFVFL